MTETDSLHYAGAAVFALAVLHTFSTKWFEHLARRSERHAGLLHLLGEVEVVFGFWALVLVLLIAAMAGSRDAIGFLESRNFTEPLFVFVILVMAATRPILHFAKAMADRVARLLPLPEPVACYVVTLALIPLLGSFITEPAAMTLAALALRERYYSHHISRRLKYATLAVLLVNVSIGGVLMPYAAPPVLMVASQWGWDAGFMMTVFGWKAALAVVANAAGAAFLFRRELAAMQPTTTSRDAGMPCSVVAAHILFLAGAVVFSHHPVAFMGLFLFFLGFTEAYKRHQDNLLLREGLLVAFFLAGLVVIGSMQKWWLQPLLTGMNDNVLYFGAIALTSITDNAALTYLGSLVAGLSDVAKYALVAGAVTGGGLTVIANAPNPAAFAILRGCFDEESISPLQLFLFALAPTIVAVICFRLL